MQTTISGGQKRQVLAWFAAELVAEIPGLRIGGAKARLLNFAAWPLCEMIALVRYRSVWREEPRSAVRRAVLLLPVVLLVLIAATVLVFAISTPPGAARSGAGRPRSSRAGRSDGFGDSAEAGSRKPPGETSLCRVLGERAYAAVSPL